MPRFLNTYTGEFVWLSDIDANPYAILSHTWRSEQEGGEQTFDDIVKLQALCPIVTWNSWKVGPPPPVNGAFFSHPALHSKIKRACEVARNAGFRLIWIDSCCIDKRSSAELSEAINSMYALYRDADVCYVYLADVHKGTDPRAKHSEFGWSRWHRRGWTLQELIAPAHVVFLTCDWTFLGTKIGLASTLEKITRIDAEILLGLKLIKDASVAKRMSWAARRETTRVEDRAYSLLGIFGVHMSPIYGEGTNAFLRLQEEIIKHHPDQSIFAWGWNRTLLALDKLTSPDAFEHVGDVSPITGSDFAKSVGRPHGSVAPPLHCIFTPLGVRIAVMNLCLPSELARVLVDEGAARCSDCRKKMALHPLRSVALLRCTDGDGNLIALPLHCPEEDVGAAENVAIGVHVTCGNGWHLSPRVVRLSAAMFKDIEGAPTCVEVSILRHFEAPVKPKALRSHFMKDDWDNPRWRWYDRERKEPSIRLAPSCEEELRSVGFTLTPLESCWPEDAWGSHMSLTTTLNMTSTSQQLLHDDQQRHVSPVHIELGLWPRRNTGGPIGQFAIDRVHKPSAIESAHPVSESPAPPGVPSGHQRLDEDSRCTPATVDAGEERCERRSSFIKSWESSRTIAEAQFTIPDPACADGAPTDSVRLLRLALEYPLGRAHSKDYGYLLFSVAISEPFITKRASAKIQPAGAPTSSAPLERTAGRLLMEAATETPISHGGLSQGLGGTLSQYHDVMQDSLELEMSQPRAATSKNMTVQDRDPERAAATATLAEHISERPLVQATEYVSASSPQDESADPPTTASSRPWVAWRGSQHDLTRLLQRPHRWIPGHSSRRRQ